MRFFFYGTLLDGSDNAVALWVHDHLRHIGRATTQGTLIAVPDPAGWYPALLPGEGPVHGQLYEAPVEFGATDMARLDRYEDCDPLRLAESLYLRELIQVFGEDGSSSMAHAYRFNQPLSEGFLPIPGGDFRAWLAELGMDAFSELR